MLWLMGSAGAVASADCLSFFFEERKTLLKDFIMEEGGKGGG